MSLWDDLGQTIAMRVDPDAVGHALNESGFLFEKSVGHPHDSLWSAQVAGAEMDLSARGQLRDIIVEFVRQHPHDPAVVSAYWALGKLEDKSLAGLYAWALAYFLENGEPPGRPRGSSALFQVLVALGNIGEHPFGEHGGGSSGHADEHNARLARAYLARLKSI